MRCIWLIFSIAVIIGFTSTAFAEELTDKTICICDDQAEWPPYHYLEREKTKKIVGYGIDVINEIFAKNKVKYKIEFLPWKRCQREVEVGKKYQMALSGSYSLKRDKAYYMVSWYKTTPYYFYSKKHFQGGLKIKTMSDFKYKKICGLLGYSYNYLGELEKQMYKGIIDYDAMIKILHMGRYDITFEQYEIFAGYTAIGKNYLGDKDLGYAKVPGAKPTWFYFMVSKKFEHSLELKKILAEGVSELFWSGKFEPLLKKHGLIAQ